MVSVLIFTKNEELDLPACLRSVSWSDDLHVFDSFSTDKTVQIAAQSGARVQQRKFDNYASQKNAGLHEVKFRYDWVLLLDADERVPAPLASQIREFVSKVSPQISAARLRRRDYFLGIWLKHAQISPFYIRLVRPHKVHYEREVNEVLKVEGKIAELSEPFDHFPFSKGISHWIDKHNTYSTMEAKIAFDSLRCGERFSLRQALFAKDFHQRRFHQKGVFLSLPFRPLIKFAYMMLVRRAFLDGRAGIAYAVLQSFYEYLIVLKARELEAAPRGQAEASTRNRVLSGQAQSLEPTPPLQEPADPIMLLAVGRVVFVGLFGVVVYLSWKPEPSIYQVSWMPRALAGWFDAHDFLKNAIGYGVFGLIGFVAWCQPGPQMRSVRSSLILLACFCAFALILELGQLALPYRVCDWRDVLAAWVGIAVVWAMFQLARFFLTGRISHPDSAHSHLSQINKIPSGG
jgi:glycosyltransferase involved in cell wall biosynthesis